MDPTKDGLQRFREALERYSLCNTAEVAKRIDRRIMGEIGGTAPYLATPESDSDKAMLSAVGIKL